MTFPRGILGFPEQQRFALIQTGQGNYFFWLQSIDDPNLGWKGRALYSNYGTHFVWHIEGGKGTKGKIVKFQVRPDPLAR